MSGGNIEINRVNSLNNHFLIVIVKKKSPNKTYCFPFSPTGLSIEQAMLKDLKELSDGEIKVAISTVNMALEVRVGVLFSSDGFHTVAVSAPGTRRSLPHKSVLVFCCECSW